MCLEFRDQTANLTRFLLGGVELRSELEAQGVFRLVELDAQGGELCFDAPRELQVLRLHLKVVGALCFDLNLRGHATVLVTLVRRCSDVNQCLLRRRQ